MSTTPPGDDVQRLREGYVREAEQYGRAARVVEDLLNAISRGQEMAGIAGHLAAVLAETAATDAGLEELKRRCLESGRQAAPELQAAVRLVASAVERLLEKVSQAEQEAAARRARLLPELDVLARASRMKSLYGRSGRGDSRGR